MKWIKLEETKVSITVRLMKDRTEIASKTFESIVSCNYVRHAAEYTVGLCCKENIAVTFEMKLFFEEYDIDTCELIDKIGTQQVDEMDRLAGLPVKGDICYHLEGVVGKNDKNVIEIDKMFSDNADLVMCVESLKMLFSFVSIHASEMVIKDVHFVDKR